jgi:hypothetical protein
MRRIAVKFVPRLLTNDQQQRRVNVCLELREKDKEDPTLRKMTFMVLLKLGKKDGTPVYVPKDTILKEVAAKIE